MSDTAVPIFMRLSEVYDDLTAANTRYLHLEAEFTRVYGEKPSLFVRAPGRVNLIGEHVDYSGYSVLPMAIERDTVIAIGFGDNSSPFIQVHNIVPSYTPAKWPTKEDIFKDIDYSQNNKHWSAYIQCGLRGAFESLQPKELSKNVTTAPLKLLVDCNVPSSAGLSSSSSIVCASALAVAAAYRWTDDSSHIGKRTISEVCCASERYIGTSGGGMDQAISLLSTRSTAQRIDFNPLRNTPVRLPENAVFIIMNTYQESNKSSASSEYNMRVLECKLSALILAHKLNVSLEELNPHIYDVTLGYVQTKSEKDLTAFLAELDRVYDSAHRDALSIDEVSQLLSGQDVLQMFSGHRLYDILTKTPKQSKIFKCYNRAKHVYSESLRVYSFESICKNIGLTTAEKENTLKQLGELMIESHKSCKNDFECSSDQLDKLVEISINSGAIGCRLTGAGWGGCAVALVPSVNVSAFISRVSNEYYLNFKRMKAGDRRLESAIFPSPPGAGGAIIKINFGSEKLLQEEAEAAELARLRKRKLIYGSLFGLLALIAAGVATYKYGWPKLKEHLQNNNAALVTTVPKPALKSAWTSKFKQ